MHDSHRRRRAGNLVVLEVTRRARSRRRTTASSKRSDTTSASHHAAPHRQLCLQLYSQLLLSAHLASHCSSARSLGPLPLFSHSSHPCSSSLFYLPSCPKLDCLSFPPIAKALQPLEPLGIRESRQQGTSASC